jgi:hypothetical protein
MCLHPNPSLLFIVAEIFGIALAFNVLGLADRAAGYHTILGPNPRVMRAYGVIFCIGVLAVNLPAWLRC